MNCKPGDLAIIIGDDPKNPGLTGMIVEVLYPPPAGPFDLPNGVPHKAVKGVNTWVIRFTRPRPVRWSPKKSVPNEYAVCPDAKLKPLPGESEPNAIPAPSRELEPTP